MVAAERRFDSHGGDVDPGAGEDARQAGPKRADRRPEIEKAPTTQSVRGLVRHASSASPGRQPRLVWNEFQASRNFGRRAELSLSIISSIRAPGLIIHNERGEPC